MGMRSAEGLASKNKTPSFLFNSAFGYKSTYALLPNKKVLSIKTMPDQRPSITLESHCSCRSRSHLLFLITIHLAVSVAVVGSALPAALLERPALALPLSTNLQRQQGN
jgi:hypothetical protein